MKSRERGLSLLTENAAFKTSFCRWDMQRMRQEQQLQKLRAREEKQHAAKSKKEETTSLLPLLEAATHICVEEKIPVAAFGRPIPSLPHTIFSLPWMESVNSKGRF